MRSLGRILRPWEYPEVPEVWDWRYNVTQSANRVSAITGIKSGIVRSQATGANQPIYLPAGHYMWYPGVAGNSVSSPTKSTTGNLRLTIDFQPLSFTPGADMFLLFKGPTTNNGWALSWSNATNKPVLSIGDGATTTTISPVAAPAWTNNTRHTLRVDWADGAGATFFYDGVQTGSQVAAAKTLTNDASLLFVGSSSTPNTQIYSASVTNGSTTTYYSVDFTQCAEGATSFAQNGDTYTVNSTGAKPAQIIARPWILHDAVAYYLSTGAITLNQPCGIISCMRHNVFAASAVLYDGATGAAGTMQVLQAVGTPQIHMRANGAGGTVCANSNLAVATKGVYGAFFSAANSFSAVNQTAEVTGNPGTNNPSGLVSGMKGDGSVFGSLQETALALINQACTANRYRQIIASMQREYA